MNRWFGIVLVVVLLESQPTNEKAIEPLLRRVSGETAVEEPTWFCIHRVKAEKVWKTLKSPGYPDSLDMKHSRCTWKISAPGRMNIRVAFRGVGLTATDSRHCSSNYLEIIDEQLGKSQVRLCGRKTPGDIVSKGNKLRMDLQRDPSELYQRGFSLSYIATDAKPGFYAKKTFNVKPLPPIRKPKADTKDKESKTKKPSKGKSGDENSGTGNYVLNSDGTLSRKSNSDGPVVQGNPIKRQVNSRFKKIDATEGASSGMSTLVIIAIVIGALVGLLILILIARKLLVKDKNKDKDDVVQTNSGMPVINMTNDKVIHAKRNILSPNVVVNHHEVHQPPPVEKPPPLQPRQSRWSSSSSESEDSGSNHDYRKPSQNGGHFEHRNKDLRSSKTSRRMDAPRQSHGVTNQTYEEEAPRKTSIRERSPDNRRRQSSNHKSNSSPIRKIYRYYTHKNHGLDQKKAIEALNNEKFCEYGNVYRSGQQFRVSTNEKKSFEHRRGPSRSSSRRRSGKRVNVDVSSEESDDSGVFPPPEIPRRKSKPPPSPHKERKLPGYHADDGKQYKNGIKSGQSRTWDVTDKPRSKSPSRLQAKRRSTVGGSSERRTRKEFRREEERRQSDKYPRYISKKDFKMEGLAKTRSRFDTEPSPSLPRHVVPASRG